MKEALVLVVFCLFFAETSRGNLGETKDELTKRFGSLESQTGDTLFYKWYGRLVRVDLMEGKAGKISFAGVSEIDVDDLLKEYDGSGKGWESKETKDGKRFFKNKKGDKADFVKDQSGSILRFYSKEWVKEKGTDVVDMEALDKKSRDMAFIGFLLENAFSILILIMTITFFSVFYFKLFRALSLITANTQRASESTQYLLSEVQRTNQDLNAIKAAVAPNLYEPNQEQPPQDQ